MGMVRRRLTENIEIFVETKATEQCTHSNNDITRHDAHSDFYSEHVIFFSLVKLSSKRKI